VKGQWRLNIVPTLPFPLLKFRAMNFVLHQLLFAIGGYCVVEDKCGAESTSGIKFGE